MTKLSSAVIKKTILQFAIFSTLSYIGFFIVIRLTGLSYSEWGYCNFAIYCITAWYGLKAADKKSGNDFGYFQGVLITYMVGVLSFILFGLLIFIYSFFDSFFNTMVFHMFPSANAMGRFAAPFMFATEGIVFCSILSLLLIQFYRVYHKPREEVILDSIKENITLVK